MANGSSLSDVLSLFDPITCVETASLKNDAKPESEWFRSSVQLQPNHTAAENTAQRSSLDVNVNISESSLSVTEKSDSKASELTVPSYLTFVWNCQNDENSTKTGLAKRSLTFADVPLDGDFFLKIRVKIMCLPDQPCYEFVESIQTSVSALICSLLNKADQSYRGGILNTKVGLELRCFKTNECVTGVGRLRDFRVFTDALRFSMEPVALVLAVGRPVSDSKVFSFRKDSMLPCQKALEQLISALNDQLKLSAAPRLKNDEATPRMVYQKSVSLLHMIEAALKVEHNLVFKRIALQFERLASSVLPSQNIPELCQRSALCIAEFINAYTISFDVPVTLKSSFTVAKKEQWPTNAPVEMKNRLFISISSLHRFNDSAELSVNPVLVECSLCESDGSPSVNLPSVSFTFEHRLKNSQPNIFTLISNEDEFYQPLSYLNSLTPASVLRIKLYSVILATSLSSSSTSHQRKVLLGWANVPVFNKDGDLKNGVQIIPLWSSNMYNSATETSPCTCVNMDSATCLLLVTSFKADFPLQAQSQVFLQHLPSEYCRQVLPPHIEEKLYRLLYTDLDSLSEEDKSFFWTNRLYLKNEPKALPILLHCAPARSPWLYNELATYITEWPVFPDDPLSFLRLLSPTLVNPIVTQILVFILSERICSDAVIDMCLPQFVLSLRRHGWKLGEALIRRSSDNHEISVSLFWLLYYEANNCEFKCCRRLYSQFSTFLRGVMGNAAFLRDITNQQAAVSAIMETAEEIYRAKNSAKQVDLQRELRSILKRQSTVFPNIFTFPCVGGSDTHLTGVEASECAVLSSRAAPLRLKFTSSENIDASSSPLMCIVKIGDDLRNDLVALQLVRIMDYIWMSCQLDLRVVTFKVLPTNVNQGIIEFVPSVDQLRIAQGDSQLSKHALVNWFTSRGADKELDPAIVDTFTRTCAAWCVASYLIGVGDRHNDNILINRNTGHLFHIDFGKLFGDAECIAGVRRDRVPFIFTDSMAMLISGGQEFGQDSAQAGYRQFVDTCCLAFNLIRRHGESILLSAVRGLRFPPSCVQYLKDCLMLHLTDNEASAAFEKMIKESVKSVAPQFNFLIHSIAQKFVQQPPTLSASQTSSLSTSVQSFETVNIPVEALLFAEVMEFRKFRYPVKHYIYQISVVIDSNLRLPLLSTNSGSLSIFRRFSEIYELRESLVQQFTLLNQQLPSFRSKGATENRETAKKRLTEVNNFLKALFGLTLEVRRSPVIAKFFKIRSTDIYSATSFAKTDLVSSSSSSSLASLIDSGQLWLTVTLLEPESPVLEVFVHRGLNLFFEHRRNGQNIAGRVRVILSVGDYSSGDVQAVLPVNELNGGNAKFRTDMAPPSSQPLFNKHFRWRLPRHFYQTPAELSLVVKVKVHPTYLALNNHPNGNESASSIGDRGVASASEKYLGLIRLSLTKMVSVWPITDTQYYKLALENQ